MGDGVEPGDSSKKINFPECLHECKLVAELISFVCDLPIESMRPSDLAACALQHAADSLKADRDVVMAAVRQDDASPCHVLECASKNFKNDHDFVFDTIRMRRAGTGGAALWCASEDLKSDQDFVLAAI